MPNTTKAIGLARDLSFRDGVAIVVGTVIGSGIYLVPGSVARQIPSMNLVMLVWLAGGLLTLFGALSLAELGAMYPGAGGLYVYLRAAYGRPIAFLYGWGLLTLIHSGSIATLAVAFGLYLSQLMPLSAASQKAASIAVIVLLTMVNILGLRTGKLVQNIMAFCKVGGIALLVVMLLIARPNHTAQEALLEAKPGPPLLLAIGAALVAVLWAYEGWHVVSFTAAEFRNPARDLPKSLLWGAVALAAIYLTANVAYYHVLTPAQLQTSDRAAATAVNAVYGGPAAALVTALIVASILGAVNGMVLTGPRVYFAMAEDGMFFRSFGKLNAARAPVLAILLQAVWSSCLTLAGSFQELFTFVVFTAWIFYGLSVFAVIVLRRRRPDLDRPYRVPYYPAIPILFVLAALFITIITVVNGPLHALYGIVLILIGLPVYWLGFRHRSDA
jgi:APA family basic amino acid/polyamine antiporter